MGTSFALVTPAHAEERAVQRFQPHFFQRREGVVDDDHPITTELGIDGEVQVERTGTTTRDG